MRALLSVLEVALLIISAITEAAAKGRRPKRDAPTSENSEKKKTADSAYQKALQQIPDSKEKPDPWSGVRSH
jgi:hypothetical protein